MNEQEVNKLSDEALMGLVRPYLDEAYDLMSVNESWLQQLVGTVRAEIQQPADILPLTEWALSDQFDFSPAAVALLESDGVSAVLVRLVAELAHIVLMDKETAHVILVHLEQTHPSADQVVRAALTGRIEGPPLAQVMALLGKQRCMNRAAAVLRG